MKRLHIISKLGLAFSVSVLAIITSISQASVTYQYTGNNYSSFFTTPSMFDTSMRVSGSFTVDSLLISINDDISNQVTNYLFSDGVNTYAGTDPNKLSQFIANTDSNGNITSWILDIGYQSTNLQPGDTMPRIISQSTSDDQAQIYQCDFLVGGSCIFSQIDGAEVIGNPGSWSVVPIPPAVWLFGSGLLGLVGIARRKKAA